MLPSCRGAAKLARTSPSTQVLIPCRQKYKKKWAETKRKNAPTQLTIDAFDGMYGNGIYESQWPSIRLGLLSMPKYCAVINNYSPNHEQVQSKLTELGALPLEAYIRTKPSREQEIPEDHEISESAAKTVKDASPSDSANQPLGINERLRGLARQQDENSVEEMLPSEEPEFMPATKFVEENIEPPLLRVDIAAIEHNQHPIISDDSEPSVPYFLKAFVFPRGDISRFTSPKKDMSGFHEYYLMDAASLLPVFALGIQPGDSVCDLCASPGGKSVTMLQTFLPGSLICNDVSASRMVRLRRVLHDFFPMDDPEMQSKVNITNYDGTWFFTEGQDKLDRILVDAPCTNDRVSCLEDDNNIFTSRRSGERSRLPQLQLDLLMAACDAVRVGGTVVYSTCSLSPVQNDGVVHLAVDELKNNHKIEMAVVNTAPFREVFGKLFRFLDAGSIYGQTILPFVPNNFGPMYFAKLRRLK